MRRLDIVSPKSESHILVKKTKVSESACLVGKKVPTPRGSPPNPPIGHLGPKSDFSKKSDFLVFFLYILFGVLRWGHLDKSGPVYFPVDPF